MGKGIGQGRRPAEGWPCFTMALTRASGAPVRCMHVCAHQSTRSIGVLVGRHRRLQRRCGILPLDPPPPHQTADSSDTPSNGKKPACLRCVRPHRARVTRHSWRSGGGRSGRRARPPRARTNGCRSCRCSRGTGDRAGCRGGGRLRKCWCRRRRMADVSSEIRPHLPCSPVPTLQQHPAPSHSRHKVGRDDQALRRPQRLENGLLHQLPVRAADGRHLRRHHSLGWSGVGGWVGGVGWGWCVWGDGWGGWGGVGGGAAGGRGGGGLVQRPVLRATQHVERPLLLFICRAPACPSSAPGNQHQHSSNRIRSPNLFEPALPQQHRCSSQHRLPLTQPS